MSANKLVGIVIAVLLLAGGTLPASAQQSCFGLYNRMMGAYQSEGPYSPRYAELLNRYNARCMGRPAPIVVERPSRRMAGLCEELRLACMRKDELGERGEGNCRRYRQTCRP